MSYLLKGVRGKWGLCGLTRSGPLDPLEHTWDMQRLQMKNNFFLRGLKTVPLGCWCFSELLDIRCAPTFVAFNLE